MMTTFKNNIQALSMSITAGDSNAMLSFITKYAWISAGGLFVCYLYFVGAITFSVIKQEALAQEIKATISHTSKEELNYLTIQKSLTEGYAKQEGFVSAPVISYTVPASTFAWNFNVRE